MTTIAKRRCACCHGEFPMSDFRKHGYRAATIRYDVRCKTCATRQDRINRLKRQLNKLMKPTELARSVKPMFEVERRAIEHAVRVTGNPAIAAKLLGIGKATIYRRLAEYGQLTPLPHNPRLLTVDEMKVELARLVTIDKAAAATRRSRSLERLAADLKNAQ